MRTITGLLVAIATCSCAVISGIDLTTVPTADNIAGSWRAVIPAGHGGLECALEFASNGTGVVAIEPVGTNVCPEVLSFVWWTTTSNLVIEADGTNAPKRLYGRLLGSTLILTDQVDANGKDVAWWLQAVRAEGTDLVFRPEEMVCRVVDIDPGVTCRWGRTPRAVWAEILEPKDLVGREVVVSMPEQGFPWAVTGTVIRISCTPARWFVDRRSIAKVEADLRNLGADTQNRTAEREALTYVVRYLKALDLSGKDIQEVKVDE